MSPSLPSHPIHNIHYSLYMPRRSALTVEVKDVAVYYSVICPPMVSSLLLNWNNHPKVSSDPSPVTDVADYMIIATLRFSAHSSVVADFLQFC